MKVILVVDINEIEIDFLNENQVQRFPIDNDDNSLEFVWDIEFRPVLNDTIRGRYLYDYCIRSEPSVYKEEVLERFFEDTRYSIYKVEICPEDILCHCKIIEYCGTLCSTLGREKVLIDREETNL